MANFEVEIKGLKELRQAFRDYPKISEPILQRAVAGTGAIFAKHTLKNDPVPFRTGFLLQSFRFSTGRLQSRWSPMAFYAPFVEFGTRPHDIFPLNARVLAWTTGGGGKYVTAASGRSYYRSNAGAVHFAAYVHHPGTKPKPFMEKIVKKATPNINKLFVQALDLINKEIANRVKAL